jgi:hypothetical protein
MVRVAIQDKSRFDPIADAGQLDALDPVAAVLRCEFFGCDSRCFEDALIEDELLRRVRSLRVRVGDRLRRRFDRGLTGALRTRGGDDAILSRAKTHDRGGRDPERKYDSQHRLTTFVPH